MLYIDDNCPLHFKSVAGIYVFARYSAMLNEYQRSKSLILVIYSFMKECESDKDDSSNW